MSNQEPFVTNGELVDKAPFKAVVFLKMLYDDQAHTCTGTFVHERLILTAAHCLPYRNTKESGSWSGETRDSVWNGGKWSGRDGKPTGSITAYDGLYAEMGHQYDVDYVYFPKAEHYHRDAPPDVAILRTSTSFAGQILPLMHSQDLPTHTNILPRYELTWPFAVGYSSNNDKERRARRIGQAETENDIEMDERAFKLDAHGRPIRGSRTQPGDSGGPLVWPDGFGSYRVGAVASFGDRGTGERGEQGFAFIPPRFLNAVAKHDEVFPKDSWDEGVVHYNGARLVYLGTTVDQCSKDTIYVVVKNKKVGLGRGVAKMLSLETNEKGSPAVALRGRKVRWYCGDAKDPDETEDLPLGTTHVMVRRTHTEDEIKWDCYRLDA